MECIYNNERNRIRNGLNTIDDYYSFLNISVGDSKHFNP